MLKQAKVAKKTATAKKAVHKTAKRDFRPRKIRWVRRGHVSDRRPNLKKKGIEIELAETIFLATPCSYVKPENSLHDHFLRMRLQHWDKWVQDAPEELNLPKEIPYEVDRVPTMWPNYNTYAEKEELAKGPLIFYRLKHLRYDEPSFIHVVQVKDKWRKNKYGRSTVLTAWHTWRGVTHPFPKQVTSRRKSDWRRLDPSLGFMTQEIWQKLQSGEIKPYFLPRPPYMDDSLEPEYMAREEVRMADLIESTKSKVV
eukprot:UN00953